MRQGLSLVAQERLGRGRIFEPAPRLRASAIAKVNDASARDAYQFWPVDLIMQSPQHHPEAYARLGSKSGGHDQFCKVDEIGSQPRSASDCCDRQSCVAHPLVSSCPRRHSPKIVHKKPGFRGMLCFNLDERTLLIRKGNSLRMVAFGASLRALAKWGICNAGCSFRSVFHFDLLNLAPGESPGRARRSNCRS